MKFIEIQRLDRLSFDIPKPLDLVWAEFFLGFRIWTHQMAVFSSRLMVKKRISTLGRPQ